MQGFEPVRAARDGVHLRYLLATLAVSDGHHAASDDRAREGRSKEVDILHRSSAR